MAQIVEVHERQDLYEQFVEYIWKHWGEQNNFNFYKNCIDHSSDSKDIPKFYVVIEDDRIVGCYAILRSDLNSRQDLFPWFACLHVSRDYRGNKIGDLLQNHAINQTDKMGFKDLYLCTDLEGYYERLGWKFLDYGYLFNGHKTRIYKKETSKVSLGD